MSYKYVIKTIEGEVLEWCPGDNHELSVPATTNDLVEVNDTWPSSEHGLSPTGVIAWMGERCQLGNSFSLAWFACIGNLEQALKDHA